MTAEPDLLPSSIAAFTEALHGERGSLDAWLEVNDEREVRAHVEAYAHACIAELQQEVEALRAEVEDYRTNGAAAVRFAPSSAHWSNELRRLFGDDARTGIEVLENQYRQKLARDEQLKEALQLMVEMVEMNGFGRDYAMDVARTALRSPAAQENDDA